MESNKETKKTNLKGYLEDSKSFYFDKLKKKFGILLGISIVLVVLTLIGTLRDINYVQESSIYMGKELSPIETLKDKYLLGIFTVFAGIVPHTYIPLFGYLLHLYSATKELLVLVLNQGYVLGLLKGIFPLVLNIIATSLFASIGIYVCKICTNKFTEGQIKSLNIDTFRINIYNISKNETKKKELEEKIKIKKDKRALKEMKLNYKQIFNFSLMGIIILTISFAIQKIINLTN